MRQAEYEMGYIHVGVSRTYPVVRVLSKVQFDQDQLNLNMQSKDIVRNAIILRFV